MRQLKYSEMKKTYIRSIKRVVGSLKKLANVQPDFTKQRKQELPQRKLKNQKGETRNTTTEITRNYETIIMKN